ncbi:hypothetical protein MPTK1_5g19867 [Marchantia polymorpha subsp. ruderalis]|uniref:Uncharacterized protein n=2 Tax=Marchantia polymorpha TaxID=3197 RepID=A0A679DXS0_MARPO|nr:hypothetical protein MARPO_0134s0049 [Marchantia polymorpha]BBN20700.1 hypothetical protein Mp_zg00310 [Marchantia polymorpha subsp. ruderalis]|eukprot:PTQ29841.1 hypothetical protein MARPO_0134s0049 [Marchantia polymorpha]
MTMSRRRGMTIQSGKLLVWTLAILSCVQNTVVSFANLPDSTTCVTERCYGRHLTCPSECPRRASAAPGSNSCHIDCSTQCEAVCKQRKPDCDGLGAVCDDPRFVGGDGVMFYFHGQKDEDFCIVTDHRLHINAHFIGKRPAGRPRDYTWVQSLGILFDCHRLTVAATKVASWDDSADHLDIRFDGAEIYLPQIEGAMWASASAEVVVERLATYNAVHVVIENLLAVSLSVVPITEHESQAHNYQITEDDCFAHLQMQFFFLELSSSVDGVLGRTYQLGYKTPVKRDVPMPVIGDAAKYVSSSLLSADCAVNQFWPVSLVADDPELGRPLEAEPFEHFDVKCQSSGTEYDGMLCTR